MKGSDHVTIEGQDLSLKPFTEDAYYKALFAETVFQYLSSSRDLQDGINNTLSFMLTVIDNEYAGQDQLYSVVTDQMGKNPQYKISDMQGPLKAIANAEIIRRWQYELKDMIETKESYGVESLVLRENIKPESFIAKAEGILLETKKDVIRANQARAIDSKYNLIIEAMKKTDDALSLSDRYLIDLVDNETPIFTYERTVNITERTLLEAYIYLNNPNQYEKYKESSDAVADYVGNRQTSPQSASITRKDSMESLYGNIMDALYKDPRQQTSYQKIITARLPSDIKQLFKEKMSLQIEREKASSPSNQSLEAIDPLIPPDIKALFQQKKALKARLDQADENEKTPLQQEFDTLNKRYKDYIKEHVENLDKKLEARYQEITKIAGEALATDINKQKNQVAKQDFFEAKQEITNTQQELEELSMKEKKLGTGIAALGMTAGLAAIVIAITLAMPLVNALIIGAAGIVLFVAGEYQQSDAKGDLQNLTERISTAYTPLHSTNIDHSPDDHKNQHTTRHSYMSYRSNMPEKNDNSTTRYTQ
jgi:hypothetical protein